jgi:hypothetical protein
MSVLIRLLAHIIRPAVVSIVEEHERAQTEASAAMLAERMPHLREEWRARVRNAERWGAM